MEKVAEKMTKKLNTEVIRISYINKYYSPRLVPVLPRGSLVNIKV